MKLTSELAIFAIVSAIYEDDIKGSSAIFLHKDCTILMDECWPNIIESRCNVRKIFASDLCDDWIDIAGDNFFYAFISEKFSQTPTISTTENEGSLWILMSLHSNMYHHLMIAPLVCITELYHAVEEEYIPPIMMVDDLYMLEFGYSIEEYPCVREYECAFVTIVTFFVFVHRLMDEWPSIDEWFGDFVFVNERYL